MHSLPPNLSADQSRDPQKFSKWRKRASRLSHALENDSLNGDTENVQHMLNQNIERLRQLGGIIPSVSRGQFRREQELHASTTELEPEVKEKIENIARELLQKLHPYIAEYIQGNDLIRRADDLWEQSHKESIMHADNRRAVALPSKKDSTVEPDFSGNFSLDKDAAQYALDQLGYE